ncbi:MAG: sigma 54-interacting transcriptional regulator [Magnetococcales bacterium]|nr:sigma 54-interacting transcriptional regulator [Magnetococcales bacterium]
MAISTPKIIGNSKILLVTKARAKKVARSDLSVLITGESGTGKELFARFIHDNSPRARKPFVAINCAAIPEGLLESSLFGHTKGAFTGADAKKDGIFVQANGGTLFLDEIGDMPFSLQAKILRVLQEGVIQPVGSRTEEKVDVRIVSATHRDLIEMAKAKEFREDLIYRLEGFSLHLPALHDRGHDIVTLARTFLKSRKEFSNKSLSRDAHALLMAYSWPGNIRELQNVILAAAVEAPMTVGGRHLRPHMKGNMTKPANTETSIEDRLLASMENKGRMTLAQLRANFSEPRSTLHRHLMKMSRDGTVQRITYGITVWFTTDNNQHITPPTTLSDRQTQALKIAKATGRITRKQFAEAIGISISTAGRELAGLIERGMLVPDGRSGKWSGYILPSL